MNENAESSLSYNEFYELFLNVNIKFLFIYFFANLESLTFSSIKNQELIDRMMNIY